MLQEVYAEVDKVNADFELWMWRREQQQLKQRSSSRDLVVYSQPIERQQPMTVQQPKDWSEWDHWCETKIKHALAERLATYSEDVLDGVGEALSLLRAELKKEFEEQLGALRADTNVQVGIQRGQVAQLLDKAGVPMRRGRNGGG
jgi:hypothetical protein